MDYSPFYFSIHPPYKVWNFSKKHKRKQARFPSSHAPRLPAGPKALQTLAFSQCQPANSAPNSSASLLWQFREEASIV